MMKIAAAIIFICYALLGAFILALLPGLPGTAAILVCLCVGLWVSHHMLRVQVQPI